jgi:hypothetical protein
MIKMELFEKYKKTKLLQQLTKVLSLTPEQQSLPLVLCWAWEASV